jgi:hypothetical protein
MFVLSFFSGTGFQPVKPIGWKPVRLRLPREESRSSVPAQALLLGFLARQAKQTRGNDKQDCADAAAVSLYCARLNKAIHLANT